MAGYNVFQNVTEVFRYLDSLCNNVIEHIINELDGFVVIMYDQPSSATRVNGARLDLFALKQRPQNDILPSGAALVEHI